MTKSCKKRISAILLIGVMLVNVSSTGYKFEYKSCNGGNLWWITQRPIAHRGLHNEKYPENTISAFKNAVKGGYPIELDVQFTKDKEVVVFHDTSLKRLTKDTRDVKDVTYKELKKLKLLDTTKKIPLFKDVLKAVDGKVPILVEIKSCDDIVNLTEAVNSILRDYEGEYAVESFDVRVINWYFKNEPQVEVGLLARSIDNIVLSYLDRVNFIAISSVEIRSEKSQQLRRLGYPIIVWTICNEEQKLKVEKYCDNYIFDYGVR